jgi:hypothetical protein
MDALLDIYDRIESHYEGFQPERISVSLKNYHQHLERSVCAPGSGM